MKYTTLIFTLLLTLNLSAISIGEVPKNITLDGENGGLAVDNSAWNSSSLKEKVLILFYIDPDEKATNEHFSKALKAKVYDRENYGSIAIVNLAATWKPDFIIESILKDKQIEFPDTLYVKDAKSVLVNEWAIEDNASNILIFSKTGELLFYKSGAMSEEDITKAFELIEANL
jgi:hypothetical protein